MNGKGEGEGEWEWEGGGGDGTGRCTVGEKNLDHSVMCAPQESGAWNEWTRDAHRVLHPRHGRACGETSTIVVGCCVSPYPPNHSIMKTKDAEIATTKQMTRTTKLYRNSFDSRHRGVPIDKNTRGHDLHSIARDLVVCVPQLNHTR